MKWKICTLSFLFLFLAAPIKAQSNQFQFSHLDINNGLSHNDLNAIERDTAVMATLKIVCSGYRAPG